MGVDIEEWGDKTDIERSYLEGDGCFGNGAAYFERYNEQAALGRSEVLT